MRHHISDHSRGCEKRHCCRVGRSPAAASRGAAAISFLLQADRQRVCKYLRDMGCLALVVEAAGVAMGRASVPLATLAEHSCVAGAQSG